jgi:hypothetical protein
MLRYNKTKNEFKIIQITYKGQDLVVKNEINLDFNPIQSKINNNIFFDAIVNK